MKKANTKKWTILIYANGNNELEPEMCNSMLTTEIAGSTEDINVLIQLGRMERSLVSVIRNRNDFDKIDNNWTGVRRYLVQKRPEGFDDKAFFSKPVEDLGKINMADPKCLFDFIQWGMTKYPAQRYMLIIGGHSFLYLGTMPDYTQSIPYIMGIPEMSKAINLIKKDIDIMVFDTCNMNFIEILYEFTKDKYIAPKTLITYLKDGPLDGLKYNIIIDTLQRNISTTDLRALNRKIIDNLNLDLVSIDLSKGKFKKIKQNCNDIGKYYIDSNYDSVSFLGNLSTNSQTDEFHHQLLEEFKRSINSIIIYYKKVHNTKANLLNIGINIGSDSLLKVIKFYQKLSFTKENYLTQLLIGDYLSLDNSSAISLKPIILSITALYKLILITNPSLDSYEGKAVLEEFLQKKGWAYNITLE